MKTIPDEQLSPNKYITCEFTIPGKNELHTIGYRLVSDEPVTVYITNDYGLKDFIAGKNFWYAKISKDLCYHEYICQLRSESYLLLVVNNGKKQTRLFRLAFWVYP